MSVNGDAVLSRLTRSQPPRIRRVHRIPAHIGVEIDAAAMPDRVGLHEDPELGVIGAGLVMIEPRFGEPDLARIAEPALV